jgi:hypothetical protein
MASLRNLATRSCASTALSQHRCRDALEVPDGHERDEGFGGAGQGWPIDGAVGVVPRGVAAGPAWLMSSAPACLGGAAHRPADPRPAAAAALLPDLARSAVNFHLDHLARSKLRLRQPGAAERPRLAGRRAALASFALRFDLVREEHLDLLPSAREPTG